MKSPRYDCGLILILLTLVGCGGDDPTATGQNQSDTAATQSVFDPMVQTLDKAKAVEDLSANRTQELDKELEKSQ
jgi:hypothetical protein